MFRTSVQEEVRVEAWSILGGVAAFAFLIAGCYFMIVS